MVESNEGLRGGGLPCVRYLQFQTSYFPLMNLAIKIYLSFQFKGVVLICLSLVFVLLNFHFVVVPQLFIYVGVFCGLCFLATIWHWVYWDIEIFSDAHARKSYLDLYGLLQHLSTWYSSIGLRNFLYPFLS